MYASLLRRLTRNGLRKGMAGLDAVAGRRHRGGRAAHHPAHRADDEEVLYRTAVKAGDVFEVVARPKR